MKNDTPISRGERLRLRLVRAAVLLLAVAFEGCAARGPEQAAPAPKGPSRERVSINSRERPGIGTRWGELRESWIEPAYFARALGDRPSAVERVLYNDKPGVAAEIQYIVERKGGEPRAVKGPQVTAGGLVSFGIRDGGGEWLDGILLGRQRFAVGVAGSRYEIVLKNQTRRRLEVVVSVDGMDVLDGKPAAFKKRGYVIGPRETAIVDGIRFSDENVGAFRFSDVNASYTARTGGDTGNVGAIGLAVFSERFLNSSVVRPENRAVRRSEPREYQRSRPYAQPPDA